MQNADAFGLLHHTRGRPLFLVIQLKALPLFRASMLIHAAVLESIMAQTTVDYLERRYAALEKEIEEALHRSSTDDLAVADLRSRKLIIADEIQHNLRLVERFSKLGGH